MAPWSEGAKKGESGLVDRMWFHVNTARYKFPYENAPTACALVLDGERNIDGDISDDHIWLKTGAFEPGDAEGTFALHEDQNPSRHFNRNSGMGKWLASAGEVGLMEVLEKRQAPDRQQYEEKDALIWEGLDLEIEYVESTFKLRSGPDAGKEVQSRQPYIRAFKADGAASNSAPAAAESSAASSNGTVTEDEAKDIAKSSDSWIKYAEALTGKGLDPSHEYVQKGFYESARSA